MKMVMFGSEQNNDEFTEIIISIDKIEDEKSIPTLTGRDDVDQEYEGDTVRLCDGKLCNSSVQIKRSVAVKVCHHEVCQANNNGLPLALCLKCDEIHHLGINANHARFELTKPRMKLTRSPSSHSNASDHDSGAEEDISKNVKVEKKTRGYSTGKRIFKLTANPKRKPRRHNTDDPGRDFFRVKFHGENEDDVQMEVVPALKGKTLKDSLEPLFSSRDLSFLTHSVFLDASNTPLPLAFDTFPMGGNMLHVRANGVVKVDQRVIDIVQKIEDCKAPDYEQRPRSKSFMENGSLSRAKGNIKKLEQEEREREAKEQLKTSQRGKKNIMYFFGDESANSSQALSNPALQSVNQSMQGTLHRPKSTGKLTGLFNQPKQNKQQDTPMRAATLKEILDVYNVYGLKGINDVKDVHDLDDLALEESWTAVVDPKWIENMTKKDKDQQEATWELLSTEVTYIHKISIVKKLFILCLRNLQNEGFLKDIEIPKLFSNIETIYELNLSFWLDCLSDVVKESRKTGKPLNPLHMSESFPMFDKRFEPYITYCKEESHCLKYFKKKMLENEDFRTYITWCEEHRLCTNRLKLSDYLVKPMQRLTKYPLLLKAIHKKTQDEEMKEDIMSMIATVETLLAKVNTAMREMYEKNKLLAITKRIKNNYNVVEAVNDEMEKILTEYSLFNLMDLMPGLDQHRCVIAEGPLRLVEKQGKMDVHVFLFTDLLLITKPKKGGKYRVLKPPMMVDKLSVHASKDPGMFLLVYMNEYNTVVQAFALQGSNNDQVYWIEAIKKAQKLFMIAQLEHGQPYVTSATDTGELISPSSFVNMPEPPQTRRRSAISVESLDSDDEMGLNEAFRVNNLTRYPSDGTINTEINPENEEEEKKDEEFRKRKESVGKKREVTSKKTSSSLTDLTNVNPEIVVHKGADELIQKIPPINPDISRLRSEGVTKVSRSSSAPQKERRKVDSSVSLSRSCSEPKESKKFLRKTSKGDIITEGLPLDTSRTSISSSSLSADEAPKSESESSSLQTSLDLTSSFTLDNQQEDSKEDSSPNVFESPGQNESSSACAMSDDNEPCSPASDVSLTFETKPSEDDSGHSGRPVVRSASAPMPLGPRETRPHSESGDQGATGETSDEEAKSATFPRRSGNRKKTSPGLKALQSLSESLEIHLKESPSKQPPQIKSPLIAQQKLQSAISGPISSEPPRRKTSLPRRSSPLMSRRPESLMRSQSYTTLDSFSASPDRVKDFLTLSSDSSDHPGNESNDFDDPKDGIHLSSLKRTESEGSRLPVKPDRFHYSGLDLGSPDSIERTSPIPQINAAPETRLRKKSMSLTDLLSIGRDLTSGRDKNNDKNNSHASKKREERLSSDTTDDRGEKTTKKHQRFRLGRSKSKSGEREIKDGIASGPDIDKRKATKLFLRDSLMLESSEYV